MNIKALLKDLEQANPNIFNEIEENSQFNYNSLFSSSYKNIPKSWVTSILDMLDRQGYVVRKVTVDSNHDIKDNVIFLRRDKK